MLRLLLLLLCGLALPAAQPLLVPADSATAAFVREQVAPILSRQCWDCHGANPDKIKGAFHVGTIDRLLTGSRDSADKTLIPGNSAGSRMIQVLRLPADDDNLMPPTKAGGKLPEAAIAALAEWVDRGAPWIAGMDLGVPSTWQAPASSGTVAAPAATPATGADKDGKKLRDWIGRAHPAMVHLPLGALIVALVFELAALLNATWRPATSVCLLVALAGCAGAIASGLLREGTGYKAENIQIHEWAGWMTAAMTLLALVWSLRSHDAARNRWPARILVAAAVLISTITGHLGGAMTHGHGWPW